MTSEPTVGNSLAKIFIIPRDDVEFIPDKGEKVREFISQNFEELCELAILTAREEPQRDAKDESLRVAMTVWALYGYLLKERELRT